MIEETFAAFDSFEQQKKAILESQKNLFQKLFKEFFVAAPEIGEIKWRQYTPGFNDGDPCLFQTTDIMFFWAKDSEDSEDSDAEDEEGEDEEGDVPVDEEGEDEEGDVPVDLIENLNKFISFSKDGSRNKQNREYFEKEAIKAQKEIDKLTDKQREALVLCNKVTQILNQNQDILEDAYGDGSQISVRPNEVKVTDYDCGY